MLERAAWGSGQIARPGFPGTHPEGEFFWVFKLLGMTEKLRLRLQTRVRRMLGRGGGGGFFGVHAQGHAKSFLSVSEYARAALSARSKW